MNQLNTAVLGLKCRATKRERHWSRILALCAVAVFANAAQATPQSCGPDYPLIPPDPQGFLSAPADVCVDGKGQILSSHDLPDGAYLALNKTLRIDTEAHVFGTCHYCISGHHVYDQQRNLMGVEIYVYPPTLLPTRYWLPAKFPGQNLDTKLGLPDNPLPIGTALKEVGEHRVTFQSTAYATSCTPITDSNIVEKTVDGLTCAPRFVDERLQPQPSPQKIQVFLPLSDPKARVALDAAVAEWNPKLPPDLQFAVVTGSCGTGPNCITVEVDPNEPACGNVWYAISGDLIPGNIRLTLNSEWENFSPAGFQRTFVHELGHLLGLGDYDQIKCGVSDAAMQDQFNCWDSGVMANVTLNDDLPVRNSSYGGKSKVSCGF